MSGHHFSPEQPSPLVRNYAREVIEAYLEVAEDSAQASEIKKLYANDDVIEAATRIISSEDADWRV